ncbi:phage protease [Shinella pollutisoli]|uniref:Phage protease n=1 Tax=Shinella pollutisoli TaxID=2250594 RepID=A0ABV7DIA8_9HYPH|nr:phage protease [Shinella pollutisoli]
MSNVLGTHVLALNAAGADAPEWLQLLPAASFVGADGRGPYAAPDAAAIVARFQAEGRRLPVDENHSIDLAGKAGHPSPARGWIVELQARADGVWGKVEWTEEGRSLVAGKSYGFVSPVFFHSRSKPHRIGSIERVALTNDPNLPFLKSLHSKEDQTMLEELRKALGLPETADEAAVMTAVTAAHAASTSHAALMARIAEAAGVAKDVAADDLVKAVQARGASPTSETENAELKAQVVSLQSQISTLVTSTAREKAEATVDQAIKDGKIVPALRDHMIARHMKAPAEVETEIQHLVSINAGGLGGRKPPEGGDTATSDELSVAAVMGVDPEAFKKEHKALFGKGQ